jgi:ubiquinone/menaquinone biosynthesis C-methylase UbiE
MPDDRRSDAPDTRWSKAFAAASTEGMRPYDAIIAPLFTPWAHDLLDRVATAPGDTALDVAAGPGTVTRILAERVGPTGRVVGLDLSPAMLEIARAKPVDAQSALIEWLEGPAAPLPLPDSSMDLVVCQQGLQFFPDKVAALAEMRRVLRPGRRAGVAVWARVEEQIFGYVHDAVASVVSAEVAERYLGPFSLSGEAAAAHARDAGFTDVEVARVTLPAVLPGGAQDLVDTLPASGIAADIAALDDATRAELLADVARRTEVIRDGDALRASMTASVLLLA